MSNFVINTKTVKKSKELNYSIYRYMYLKGQTLFILQNLKKGKIYLIFSASLQIFGDKIPYNKNKITSNKIPY